MVRIKPRPRRTDREEVRGWRRGSIALTFVVLCATHALSAAAATPTDLTGPPETLTEPDGSGAAAQPDSAALANQVEQLTLTVVQLEIEAEDARARYEATAGDLRGTILAELQAQQQFDAARQDSQDEHADAERRIRALYRTGPGAHRAIAVWGTVRSLDDMAVSMKTAERLLAADAEQVENARAALDKAIASSERLLASRQATVEAQATLQARWTDIAASLGRQRGLLATTDRALVAAVEDERRRAEEMARSRAPVDLVGYGNGRIPTSALRPVARTGHLLSAPASVAFEELLAAAATAGVRVGITDSYRTYDQQVDLVRRKGLYAEGGLAALPGTSDHGWGLAVDLDLDPAAQAWMRANAGTYAFVEDVPREPWHWTYTPDHSPRGV